MRTVRIMCNDHDVLYPDGHIVGKIGEHNATMLEIKTTDDFVIGCDYFSIEIFRNEHVFYSGTITDDMGGDDNSYRAGCVFYLKLWHNLTLGKQINIVVVGYKTLPDGNAEEVRRSPVIGSLLFTGAFGCDKESEYAGGITAEVAELSRRVVELKGTDDDFFTEIEAIRNDISSSVDIARWDGAATDSHTHPNKLALDKLTVTDGELFIDGKRFGGVVVWHIVDDPVNVPSMADGTLLFITPGENGDMSYPPYYVNILGTPVQKIAPWKPGQLWVCRGGVWFLIATANRTEYKPEEVITETVLPDGEVAAISTLTEADVSASAPTEEEIYDVDPCENVDKSGGIVEAVKTLQTEAHTHSNLEALERVEATDDVVLLPFGKPLDLYLRNDFQHLQYPQSIDGEDVGIFVSSTDGRHIILYVENHLISVEYYDGETTHRSNDGEIWSGGTIHPNEEPIKDFSIRRIDIWKGGYVPYDSVEEINSDNHAKYCFDVFCRAFNTSIENMGSIKLIENVFDGNYANGLKWGRNYYITVNDSTYVLNIDWTCPIPNGDFGLRNEAYCVVYLNLEQDCDIAHEAQYIVNGESPNTKAGLHKWIFNYLYDGTVSLGAIDLEAI